MKFEAKCDVCQSIIEDPREGLLWIDLGALPHPGDEWTPHASWRISHTECIDHDGLAGSMFSLDLDQIVDPHRFLHWIAHLWRKTWLPRTNWESFLRQAGQVGPLESVYGSGRGVPAPDGVAPFEVKELPW